MSKTKRDAYGDAIRAIDVARSHARKAMRGHKPDTPGHAAALKRMLVLDDEAARISAARRQRGPMLQRAFAPLDLGDQGPEALDKTSTMGAASQAAFFDDIDLEVGK